MASGGLTDEVERRIEETRQKVKEHWENSGRLWVDQGCVTECWSKISSWLDVSALYSHLVSCRLANTSDDYHHLLGNHPPTEVKNYLLHQLLPNASHYGPYLFYMCLLASGARGHLGHSSAAKELKSVAQRRQPPAPPEISGEAEPMDRDGQRRGEEGERGRGGGGSEGGGRGRGGSGEGGEGEAPPSSYQHFSQQVVAQPQSSPENGHHSLVVAKEPPVEQRLENLSLSSSEDKYSTLNESLETPGTPPQSLFDPDVERDRPRGQPLPSSQQPSLASSSGGVSLQSGVPSLSSLQSHPGLIAEETEQAERESATVAVKRHIQCGKYQSAVNFTQEKCDLAFALREECSNADTFISCICKFIVASLNSRHQLSCAILVAGIDEDDCQPFPLPRDCQRLNLPVLGRSIFYRDSPDGQEIRISQEQVNQISLTFIPPRQTDRPSQPAPSPVAMVTVCPTPIACRSCIFTYRDSCPTARGEVWRRADGHSVKVEKTRELKKLYGQLAAQSNNCPPPHPNMQ